MASIQKRTRQDGSNSWLAQIRKKGFKTVNITKNTKSAVEKAARDIEVAMDNGTWDEFTQQQQKQGKTTLEHFIPLYLEEITPYKEGGTKTIINETSTLNLILDSPLAKMDVYKIKTGDIISLQNKWRDKGNKATTINRKLATLQDLFKHIRTTWRHEALKNPVPGSKAPVKKGAGKRSRTLSHLELTAIRTELQACKSPYVLWLFDLALETAGRRRELLENTWESVHLDKGFIYITDPLSKTRKKRFVPLTPKAISILEDIQQYKQKTSDPSNLIFLITKKSFEEAWKKARARSGVTDFQFRDTRHMSITMLSNIYPKMQDLAKITGHDKLDTLLIYYEESIEDQVKHMSAYFK